MIYLGLLLFFVLEYVRPTSYVPALLALRLNSIVPLFNFVGTVSTRGTPALKRIFEERNTLIILFLLFLVWISVLTADVTLYAYTGFTTLLGYSMAYWVMMSELTDTRRVKGIFKILVIVHLIVAVLNPDVFLDPSNRHYLSSGFFLGDGNDFALSLNIVIPLCLCLLLDSTKWWQKAFWGFSLLVLVACVVLTQSRGGTIALAAMGLYYWLKSDKKVQTALIVVAVLFLIMAYAPAAYFQRMNMLTDTQEGSAAARLTAWGVGWRMGLDHPLLGVGAGHFGVKFGTTYLPKNLGGPWMTAHSLYFLALGELGFPGLATIIVFLVWNLVANRSLAREIKGQPGRETDFRILSSTSAALIAFASGAVFLSCLWYPHIYVLCGLMGGARWVIRQRAATAEQAAPGATAPAITYHWALRRPPEPVVAARRGQR